MQNWRIRLNPVHLGRNPGSKQRPEFRRSETGRLCDLTHRDWVDRSVTWNGYGFGSLCHDGVFPLPGDVPTTFLEHPQCIPIRDAGQL